MEWTDIVTALSTLVFGGAATYLARQQWLTSERTTKIDLFELRYGVFLETLAYLSASGTGQLTAEGRNNFLDAVVKSRFLFPKKIHDYLEQLHKDSALVRTALTPDKARVIQLHWDEYGEFTQRFTKYLEVY